MLRPNLLEAALVGLGFSVSSALFGCSTPTRNFFDDRDGGLALGSGGVLGSSGSGSGDGASSASGGAGGSSGAAGASSGGITSHGGSGGAVAGGGSPGAEDCFDNVDNDGNSDVDCADAACASIATCVAAPDNFQLGVVVDKAATCPAGTTETKIYRGLTGGNSCTGCGCTVNPVGCEVDLFFYPSLADCNADATNTGGALAKHIAEPCADNVTILNSNIYTNGGFRAGPIDVIQTCQQSGTAKVTPALWTESKKFCAHTKTGGGCAAGQACVPLQIDPTAQCALNSGSALCDGFQSVANDWFTGYADTRTCMACECTAYGGGCQYPQITIGSDYTCNAGFTLSGSDKTCQGEYVPAVGINAGAVASQCTASSKFSGSLSATGQQTLCCVPN